MALTITVVNRSVEGTRRAVTADVQFDSSYPTGGEALDASARKTLGLAQITGAYVPIDSRTADARLRSVTPKLGGTLAAPTLMLYAAGAQVANASDQSSNTVRVTFLGVE